MIPDSLRNIYGRSSIGLQTSNEINCLENLSDNGIFLIIL